MTSTELKKHIKKSAITYAERNNVGFDQYESAIIFNEISDNFYSKSFIAIKDKKVWADRLCKKHPQIKDKNEMQSSNSSDALLMNIFCHPDILKWRGIRELLGVKETEPEFGFKPGVPLKSGTGDKTEIDMCIDKTLFEAKLTENDFTQQKANIVENYEGFEKYFYIDYLSKKKDIYDNYQVIRNLLAAIHRDEKHILLCDSRRPDLVRSYFQTVMGLKEISHRKRFRVVFWQEIQELCGRGLREFLCEKYSICYTPLP